MAEINNLLGLFSATRPVGKTPAVASPSPQITPEQQRSSQPFKPVTGRENTQNEKPQNPQLGARNTGYNGKAPVNILPSPQTLELSVQQARLDQQRGNIVERGSILNLVL